MIKRSIPYIYPCRYVRVRAELPEVLFNPNNFPPQDYYDYVIIDDRTASCPLMATLSQKLRVLVLERGGIPYNYPNLRTQEGFLTTLMTHQRGLLQPS